MRSGFAVSSCIALSFVLGCGDGASEDGSTDDTQGTETGGLNCEDDFVDKDPESAAEDLMTAWGAACDQNANGIQDAEDDQFCRDLLGFDNAICVADILMIYTIPGGYCSRPCELPSKDVSFVEDAADCDPDGGVNCVGAMGIYTVCAPPCALDDSCSRQGYGCIPMPEISNTGDPQYCLMNPDACCYADQCP
jgi:hypothetical protein